MSDRLGPGLAAVRVRYAAEYEPGKVTPAILHPETGEELAPEVPAVEQLTSEDAETDYIHWKDIVWTPSRVWGEVRILFFRAQMPREALVKRFGKEIADALPLNSKDEGSNKSDKPWSRADIWECWDKESKKVYWICDGYASTLDEKDDPLGLPGFWPCPRPMFANLTTTKLIPRPDLALSQDQYDEVDGLTTRIDLLQNAVNVRGAYDKASGELGAILQPNGGNKMYPVENWSMFAEKGGIKGQVDWFPLDQVVGALSVLRDQRREAIELLNQQTGMADLMRGQASTPNTTATEQSIKAKFGSVRIQALQDEFARFASDVQKLKAQIISSKFSPKTIAERSNAQFGFDQQLVPQAIDLIKSRLSTYRVEVKPENVSLTDFAALKAERMDVLGSLTSFIQASAGIAQQMPGSLPFLLEIAQWSVAGTKGASQIEGVLDQAIAAVKAQQAQAAAMPQQAAPDPKLQAIQLKGQVDMQKGQADLQNDLVKIEAETRSQDSQQRSQMEWNVKEQAAKQGLKAQMMPAGAALGPNGSAGGGL